MRTELSFLMDLFLSAEVPIPIKQMIADRIREVEQALAKISYERPALGTTFPPPTITGTPPNIAQQAPSMQRIMEGHPDVPIAVTPQSPATSIALQQRNDFLQKKMREKLNMGKEK